MPPEDYEDRYPQVEWDLRQVLGDVLPARNLADAFPAAEFSNWRYQVRRFIRAHGEPTVRSYDSEADQLGARVLAQAVAREMETGGRIHGERAMDPVERSGTPGAITRDVFRPGNRAGW